MTEIGFISTRGGGPRRSAKSVAVEGLAGDGGLYMPERWPEIAADPAGVGCYGGALRAAVGPFLEGLLSAPEIADLAAEAASAFPDDPIPIRRLPDDIFIAELFHGPTFAFKDFALQMLAGLYQRILGDAPLLIVGATTGDTGPAAVDAFRNRMPIRVAMLHPKDRISEIQRRQMTTVQSDNILNIAIGGTFDDCQAIVKSQLRDQQLRGLTAVTTVNSINIFRIIAQVAYHFLIAARIAGSADVHVAIPCGNFGNAYSAFAARLMGVRLGKVIIGTNRNDVLTRAINSGRYERHAVKATITPAMDIAVASNFERLLFSLADRDPKTVVAAFGELERNGGFDIPGAAADKLRRIFSAHRVAEDDIRHTIKSTLDQCGILLDPHSAVALAAAQRCRADISGPIAVLATAHPAKFAPTVEAATGSPVKFPARLKELLKRDERVAEMDANLGRISAKIMDWIGA